jgi:hypothetical protein
MSCSTGAADRPPNAPSQGEAAALYCTTAVPADGASRLETLFEPVTVTRNVCARVRWIGLEVVHEPRLPLDAPDPLFNRRIRAELDLRVGSDVRVRVKGDVGDRIPPGDEERVRCPS